MVVATHARDVRLQQFCYSYAIPHMYGVSYTELRIKIRKGREIIREIDVKKHELSNKLHELIQQDSANIQLVSPDSEQYGLYALIAVCKCGEALKYVPVAKRNYILCEAAVQDDPNSIMYVPDEHKEKIIEGLKKRSDWLRYVFDFNNEKFSDSLIDSDSNTTE